MMLPYPLIRANVQTKILRQGRKILLCQLPIRRGQVLWLALPLLEQAEEAELLQALRRAAKLGGPL